METITAPPGGSAAAVLIRALGPLEVRDAQGDEIRPLVAQPKRLALFAYIALNSPAASHPREKLCAMFWPESSEDHARLSLRQALHFLRKSVGLHIITSRPGDEIGIATDLLSCDVIEFERAIAEQRRADAIALYRGPFLQDFRVTGASSEFEWWVDRRRAQLHHLVIRAGQELSQIAERSGDLVAAVDAARHVARFAPFDEQARQRLVTLLDRVGDRAGALHELEEFCARLDRELDSSPSAETRALVAKLRTGAAAGDGLAARERESRNVAGHVLPNAPALSAPASPHASSAGAALAPSTTTRRLPFAGRRAAVLALAGVLTLGWAGVASVRGRATDSHVVLAVGRIRSQARDTLLAPGLLRELLASDLARIDGVDVVSDERMQELVARLGPPADTAATIATAARRAGATQVLEGILSGGGGSPLRIDVRRADLENGTIRGALVVEAADVFSLADQLSAQVAGDLGRQFPRTPIAAVSSRSLVARRFYQEGVRTRYEGDLAGSLRLFEAALGEDSTFAMAALFASQAAWQVRGDTIGLRLLDQARRMAQRASDRERLMIETAWARATNSPSAVVVAESLVTRYPAELGSDVSLGQALSWAGERDRAVRYLRRAIARDSIGLAATRPGHGDATDWCKGCDAFSVLVETELESDSVDAAERSAREWARRRPSDAAPWTALANIYEWSDRLDSARVAHAEAARLGDGRDDALFRVRLALRAGDFVTADRLLDDQIASSDRPTRVDALWWRVLSLRQQGKLVAALDRAGRLVTEENAAMPHPDGASLGHIARAQITFELGRYADAAAMFEAMAAAPLPPYGQVRLPGREARRRAWMLTHAATAYAAAGDATSLVRLATIVERLGRESASGRDQRLFHYVRGLHLELVRDWAGAASELRAAVSSPNMGFTRINLELARALVAKGQPQQAIPVLQSALRGSLEGTNYYVTRTELHSALADAFDAAGQPDSARVHRSVVAAAWAGGDSLFRERAARARRVLLERRAPSVPRHASE